MTGSDCHRREAEDKIVFLAEAIASSLFVNTGVSLYMHTPELTLVVMYVSAYVKLRILLESCIYLPTAWVCLLLPLQLQIQPHPAVLSAVCWSPCARHPSGS